MRVKHLDDLYTWKQIRKLQAVHAINPRHGFVPVALFAPGGGMEVRFWSEHDDRPYEWTGKQGPYYAKRLWEEARKALADVEAEALAFDVVEASECFNTIRFKNPEKAQSYRAEFWRQLKSLAESGTVKNAIGHLPERPYPWDEKMRYRECVVIEYGKLLPGLADGGYREIPPLPWRAVEKYFIDLTEDELAFLHGEEIINKPPRPIDLELMKACLNLDVVQVKVLLAAGANPNSFDEESALGTVICCLIDGFGDAEWAEPEKTESHLGKMRQIVDLLLDFGCDLDFAPYGDQSSVCYATYVVQPPLVALLLEKGADPNAVSWIDLENAPETALDHVDADIGANDLNSNLDEEYGLIKKRGGKWFCELFPDFYTAFASVRESDEPAG
jgi:hypothetical protein